MEKLTLWKKLKNKTYLGSWDLCIGADNKDQPVYEEKVVTISKVEQAQVADMEGIKKGNAKSTKQETIMYFKELEKPMIIHANCVFEGIEKATGTKFYQRWIDKKVCLYVEKNVKAFGTTTDALRIKPVPKRLCDVCGRVISNDIYEASMKKYNKALCSKECLEKAGIQ